MHAMRRTRWPGYPPRAPAKPAKASVFTPVLILDALWDITPRDLAPFQKVAGNLAVDAASLGGISGTQRRHAVHIGHHRRCARGWRWRQEGCAQGSNSTLKSNSETGLMERLELAISSWNAGRPLCATFEGVLLVQNQRFTQHLVNMTRKAIIQASTVDDANCPSLCPCGRGETDVGYLCAKRNTTTSGIKPRLTTPRKIAHNGH